MKGIEDHLLPRGWKWVRLGGVCKGIDYGYTTSANTSVRLPKLLRITDIQDGKVNWDAVPGCAIDERDEQAYRLCDGDIVFVRTGATTGKSYLVRNPPRAVFASYLIRVRAASEVVCPDYLDLYFKSDLYWRQISAGARGGAQPGFNATMLSSLMTPLPPPVEQKRIASILDKQMAAVERAQAAVLTGLHASRNLKSAYLRAAFHCAITQNWPKKPLGQVGAIVSGVTLGRKLRGETTRLVPYLRVANVKDGYLDLSDVYQIEATESEIAKCRLEIGDLLLTEGGDPDKLGRGTLWRGEIPGCIHQNHIFRVRFNSPSPLPEFVSAQMGSAYGKAYFLAHAKQTTGIATINQRVLAAFPLMEPSLEEQRRVSAMLDRQLALAEAASGNTEEQANAVGALPAALLRRAFSGGL